MRPEAPCFACQSLCPSLVVRAKMFILQTQCYHHHSQAEASTNKSIGHTLTPVQSHNCPHLLYTQRVKYRVRLPNVLHFTCKVPFDRTMNKPKCPVEQLGSFVSVAVVFNTLKLWFVKPMIGKQLIRITHRNVQCAYLFARHTFLVFVAIPCMLCGNTCNDVINYTLYRTDRYAMLRRCSLQRRVV